MASPVVFRHEAMATWFEIRTYEEDAAYAKQAAAEAFRRLDHLEGLLSRFKETSEISAISRLEPGESFLVHADVAECLGLAIEMEALTGGAFTPCLGPRANATEPEGRLALDPASLTVTAEGGRLSLDLGAIGKGWALDQMGALLHEWGIGASLLVAGGSSILAVGEPETPWELRLAPQLSLQLSNGSVGCSGLTVKGKHILDPRTRAPAEGPARAWALSGCAAVSDALSTAFMVMQRSEVEAVLAARPECGAFVQPEEASQNILRIGRALGVRHHVTLTSNVPEGGAKKP